MFGTAPLGPFEQLGWAERVPESRVLVFGATVPCDNRCLYLGRMQCLHLPIHVGCVIELAIQLIDKFLHVVLRTHAFCICAVIDERQNGW